MIQGQLKFQMIHIRSIRYIELQMKWYEYEK